MCDCLLHTPYWGPGLQPRHVPQLGIKLETLWFTGPCSIYRATPARPVKILTKASCLPRLHQKGKFSMLETGYFLA